MSFALLIDLSKVCDCILDDLIIANLETCGFQMDTLKLVYDYLLNRKQRVKINEAFSSWKEVEHGVPQGSICDLFYFFEDLDIASYADEITIYTVKENKESVIKASVILFECFKINFLKANSGKVTFICGVLRDLVLLIQLKNVKNTHGGVLILAGFSLQHYKINTPPWVFFDVF